MAKAFIGESTESMAFVKLYLIKKDQLLDIYKNNYGLKIESYTNTLDVDLNDLGEQNKKSITLDPSHDYGNLLYLGELDNMKIVTATAFPHKQSGSRYTKPEKSYLKYLYVELRKAFNPYSNYFVMYYIYRLDGVKAFFSVNDLINIFYKEEKEKSKDFAKNVKTAKEDISTSLENKKPLKKGESTTNYQTVSNQTFQTNGIPDKQEQLKKINHALDLLDLPVFDSQTGDFLWGKNSNTGNSIVSNDGNNLNEENLNTTNKSFLKSEDIIYGQSMNIRNGSIISLNSSIVADKDELEYPVNTLYSNLHSECNSKNFNNYQGTENLDKQKALIDDLSKLLGKLDG
eukprot:CAMPEP_0170524690 /NCGR_PEP_ID=MMETSP0209-20121228/10175_1 /TAXON_ID=665100 ORGANISM="Litonotus pictus, Strain P1" /NCGR_SAMPLE_ID=MMETSP0209 /ASSEMBLY_ACC=CAM_ASM_000301 /LENGTH=343 /DNA_ID=CAMNT_0010813543 /DNA_START=471 /DNA_END=1499 /DNA_ORIENTATION=-